MTTPQEDCWSLPTTLEKLQLQINAITGSLNPTIAAVKELQKNEAEFVEFLTRILDALDEHGPAGLAAEVDAWLEDRAR